MNSIRLLAVAAAAAIACSLPASAGEPAPLDQWRKLIDALEAAGCSSAAELSAESWGWDVEDATCADGKRRDLRLDKNFAVKK